MHTPLSGLCKIQNEGASAILDLLPMADLVSVEGPGDDASNSLVNADIAPKPVVASQPGHNRGRRDPAMAKRPLVYSTAQ